MLTRKNTGTLSDDYSTTLVVVYIFDFIDHDEQVYGKHGQLNQQCILPLHMALPHVCILYY